MQIQRPKLKLNTRVPTVMYGNQVAALPTKINQVFAVKRLGYERQQPLSYGYTGLNYSFNPPNPDSVKSFIDRNLLNPVEGQLIKTGYLPLLGTPNAIRRLEWMHPTLYRRAQAANPQLIQDAFVADQMMAGVNARAFNKTAAVRTRIGKVLAYDPETGDLKAYGIKDASELAKAQAHTPSGVFDTSAVQSDLNRINFENEMNNAYDPSNDLMDPFHQKLPGEWEYLFNSLNLRRPIKGEAGYAVNKKRWNEERDSLMDSYTRAHQAQFGTISGRGPIAAMSRDVVNGNEGFKAIARGPNANILPPMMGSLDNGIVARERARTRQEAVPYATFINKRVKTKLVPPSGDLLKKPEIGKKPEAGKKPEIISEITDKKDSEEKYEPFSTGKKGKRGDKGKGKGKGTNKIEAPPDEEEEEKVIPYPALRFSDVEKLKPPINTKSKGLGKFSRHQVSEFEDAYRDLVGGPKGDSRFATAYRRWLTGTESYSERNQDWGQMMYLVGENPYLKMDDRQAIIDGLYAQRKQIYKTDVSDEATRRSHIKNYLDAS